MTAWYLFGNSPTFEQTLLVLIITLLFANSTKLIRIEMKTNFFEKKFNNLENSFSHLAKDFKEHLHK